MPLRVAEYNGYIRAVNNCPECLFVKEKMPSDMAEILGWECIYHASWQEPPKEKDPRREVFGVGIPVWCPLPETAIQKKEIKELIDILREGRKRQDEIISSFFGKMRGLHPQNINLAESLEKRKIEILDKIDADIINWIFHEAKIVILEQDRLNEKNRVMICGALDDLRVYFHTKIVERTEDA